jgi:hypothetical protein
MTHVKREIIQRVWELLLDDDFVTAYKLGMITECSDNVVRRYFPQFFIYSCDYPEK